jgi:CDP-glucose 4,6-dehydratase
MKTLFHNIYKGKKVLVTGDTGFKGSWLCIWLKMLGADVYGYALPAKNKRDNFLKARVKNIVHHHDGDIRNYTDLKKYFHAVQPEIAFHLAAQPLVLESYSEPLITYQTNVLGTVNFFEAVRNIKSIKVAINVTTDKCYRNIGKKTGYKEDDFLGGADPYSASKSCSELVTYSYQHSFFNSKESCRIASARAGNVTGGGDWAKDRIMPDIMRAYLKKEKLYIRNPDAVRPWQFVLEPLSGYLHLASRLYLDGNKFSGAWNFGPVQNKRYSVKDLIKEVEKKLGKIKYEVSPLPFHEEFLLTLDISKAKKELGWQPALSFEETVAFTISGYMDDIAGKNILEKRMKQIEEYVALAEKKKIKWTKH